MGRHYKFKYLDPQRGGVIMEAEQYKSVSRPCDLPFVSLELLDKEDGRYRVWVGNEKAIHHTFFYSQTIEGFQDAKRKFMQHYDSTRMSKHTDWSEQEEKRLQLLFGEKPEKSPPKIDTSALKNEMQLKRILARMIKKGQINQVRLNEIFKEESNNI